MSSDPKSNLDEKIEELSNEFVRNLSELSARDFVREGVIKEAISSVIWGIYYKFPDQREQFADFMEDWQPILRDAINSESAE
ncbi:hypothetical protein [Novosphingobium capsulatum]|uniref:hypothetical protein n=1 Tax=Novosphingobium capsulatum TaxID=13688 RepID=UPI000A6B8096|nr:hypothetical protein [Novosphingobium capsulatum]WQD92735.1 hypothetical protein U0041_17400 [Novosphingobium capsulatum]